MDADGKNPQLRLYLLDRPCYQQEHYDTQALIAV